MVESAELNSLGAGPFLVLPLYCKLIVYDPAVRVSELLSLDVRSVNLEAVIPYIRIYGKGNKERIVAVTDAAAAHLRNYIKLYHPEHQPDKPLIYTVIKGQTNRMSVGNVERIIKNMRIRYGLAIQISPKAVIFIC